MDNQKKNTGLYVLIAILCVLVLALGGFIVYDKTQNNKTTTTDTTNNASNSTNTNSLVSKLDDKKDWVYDAEYTKNVTADSYSTYYETYYAKDIVVPYINVNSSYSTIYLFVYSLYLSINPSPEHKLFEGRSLLCFVLLL